MQLMTWQMGRLGGRFSLVFEPYHRRVLHSAMGRFLDRPMDLMVGLVEPDGTERTLPFTTRGTPLQNVEQFERFNSITYRGFSEKYQLRFEFNVHSVFYPEHERLCLLPAFYLEMRVSPVERVRWTTPAGPTPEKVRLFLRIGRPDTQITASSADGGRIDLAYRSSLEPRLDVTEAPPADAPSVEVRERIVSLNGPTDTAHVDESGAGLWLDLPVTEVGSGTKWRLVWAAHVSEPVLAIGRPGAEAAPEPAKFRYNRYWSDLDAVVHDAVEDRDNFLAHSRTFEKMFEQAPLDQAQRHLIDQSFQSFLANTFWCDLPEGPPENSSVAPGATADRTWFSVWEGSCFFHSTVDVEYNVSLLYLTLWPGLLAVQLEQWPRFIKLHEPSGGGIMSHDVGRGTKVQGQAYDHDMPVEENANYLLMLQVYVHWTGDLELARRQADAIRSLATYLIWTDRDASGFPSEGTANTIDDATPAVQFARKQTYLAVKRLTALRAASDLLERLGDSKFARRCDDVVDDATPRIEREAWLGDHYAVCVDRTTSGVIDAWTGHPLDDQEIAGWDAYSIYTGNGLLLPLMCGLPPLLDAERLVMDCHSAIRETKSPYGCGHTSVEPENVWVSQNMWRDHLMRYLGQVGPGSTSRYWDMQVMSNTDQQSLGFVDTYVTNNLSFYPRGIASIGYLLARSRLIVDRLAPGGPRISVDPDRHWPQRWPLLALADWKLGKVPVCVVDADGRVRIESETDPVIVRGAESASVSGVIG